MKKYIFSKVTIVLCLLSFLPAFEVCAKPHPPKTTPGTAIFVMASVSPITVITKHIMHQDETIYLDIKIPKLKGLSDEKFQKKLNKQFLKEGIKKEKQIIKEAKDYNAQNLEDGLPALKFEFISSYTLITAPEPYFVIEFLDYQYNGGAHGLSTEIYVVIDTEQNKVLQLQDLFQEGVDYYSLINAEINRQIAERTAQGEYFFTGAEGFKGIKENQPFYINSEGDLVIVFNVYEIAPYAAGVIQFPISKQNLSSFLK